jgi:hypothetical protein
VAGRHAVTRADGRSVAERGFGPQGRHDAEIDAASEAVSTGDGTPGRSLSTTNSTPGASDTRPPQVGPVSLARASGDIARPAFSRRVCLQLAKTAKDLHEWDRGSHATSQTGLDGADVPDHRVMDPVVAPLGGLIDDLGGCAGERHLF